jgi:hypothetical protein
MKSQLAAFAVLATLMNVAVPVIAGLHHGHTSCSGPTIPPGPWDDDDSSSGGTK